MAAEQSTGLDGAAGVVPTPVGGGGVLGRSVVQTADRESLVAAYGEFVAEAPTVFATYPARSVCPAGFKATRAAWPRLFPPLTLGLCSLHSLRKITERGRGA